MSNLDTVEIQKGKPGAIVNAGDTATSALIAGGVAVTGKLELGKVYTIYRPDDAIALGINEAYDTDNKVVLYHHIDEFYRMAGEGTTLHLMVLAQSVLPATILANQAHTLVTAAKGEIRQLAIAFNPAEGYTETLTDGFNNDVRAAISPAQEFYAWCYESDRPLNILLEGRSFTDTPSGAINLRSLTVGAGIPLEADKVSIIIGQDYDYAESRTWALGKKYAAVGTALGTLAGIAVNRNIGEVETLNLSDALLSKFLTAGLSSHKTVEEVESSLATLDTKGYIFPVMYTGISGYRWNGDHVCAPIIVDSQGRMNEHYISYGRTMDDATRRLKAKLLPKVKSVQPVNASDGKLPLGVVKSFNSLGNTAFEEMLSKKLISNGATYTNPESDLLTGERALEIDFDLQPTGTINKIKGTINLKKSLN